MTQHKSTRTENSLVKTLLADFCEQHVRGMRRSVLALSLVSALAIGCVPGFAKDALDAKTVEPLETVVSSQAEVGEVSAEQDKELSSEKVRSSLSEKLKMIKGIVRSNTPEIEEKKDQASESMARIKASIQAAREKTQDDQDSYLASPEVQQVFEDAIDLKAPTEARLLPVEVVYLDSEQEKVALSRKARSRGKKNAGPSAEELEDLPTSVIGAEHVPYPWYPKEDQFALYNLHIPSAFVPRKRTISLGYRFGSTDIKTTDRFMKEKVNSAEGTEHSIYYSYSMSDAVTFTAGVTKSDVSYTVNESSNIVQNYITKRNAVLVLAGQSALAQAYASQPISATPSRENENVQLALNARLYTWDRFKTSLGCGIMTNREKRKVQSLVLYTGLPGLPVTFEDLFVKYETTEAYMVLSKVIARNLTGHVGMTHERVKTAILTSLTNDSETYSFPFAGLDLVLNDKAIIRVGVKDGEPSGELSYEATRDLSLAAFYQRSVRLIRDNANPFDNFNLEQEVDRYGVSMSHRF